MKTKEAQPISRETQLRIDEYERNYWRTTGKKILKDWRLFVMLIPLILVFLFWRYFPMYNLTNAFKFYDPNIATVNPLNLDYVGLYYFQNLMFGENAVKFWPAFRNTFLLSFYGLLFGFPVPVILALFFSEIKNNLVRSAVQVCTYLPKFVSLVVITSLTRLLLEHETQTGSVTSYGILGTLLNACHVITEQEKITGLLRLPEYFRSIYQITGIWTDAGYGSIVYFAAIIGISPTSYEAARIDGATKMQQIKTVVLPGILSTIIIMLITRLGHLMTVGYEKVMLLQYNENMSTSEIVATWVISLGGMGESGSGGQESLGSAADMINAVISMLLVTGANMISRRVSSTSLY